MSAFTVKAHQFGRAPRRTELFGDKTKKTESAQHIIEFPGGAIELTRTTDGNYWAHVLVHRGQVLEDAEGLVSARGSIIETRIDRAFPGGIDEIPHPDDIEQIAVLIRPQRK